MKKTASFISCCGIIILINAAFLQTSQTKEITVIRNVTLIDGTGGKPQAGVSLVIENGRIQSVFTGKNKQFSAGAKVVDLTGKTVMPALICTHAHVGLLRGTQISPENYTEENVVRQLRKYEAYGISTVVSLGQDREEVFGLRERSRKGQLPGARILTAAFGIGAKGGIPPDGGSSGKILRPANANEAREAVRKLQSYQPDFIKIWVDDGGGSSPKMTPEVYKAVLEEARKAGIRVAAHVYYLEDARQLVTNGVSVIAHSIRDQEVDEELIKLMKGKGVFYIPTLSLDEYKFVFADPPAWVKEPAFRRSLEPGVLEMIESEAFKQQLQQAPNRSTDIAAFQMALRNVKKLHDAGVLVAMGSDSGAQPVRTQGFSEHLELEEMVNAGLTPLQAITCATRNGARLLGMADSLGTLEPGKVADFIVLDQNPEADIRHTRKIYSVWRNGKQVADKLD